MSTEKRIAAMPLPTRTNAPAPPGGNPSNSLGTECQLALAPPCCIASRGGMPMATPSLRGSIREAGTRVAAAAPPGDVGGG